MASELWVPWSLRPNNSQRGVVGGFSRKQTLRLKFRMFIRECAGDWHLWKGGGGSRKRHRKRLSCDVGWTTSAKPTGSWNDGSLALFQVRQKPPRLYIPRPTGLRMWLLLRGWGCSLKLRLSLNESTAQGTTTFWEAGATSPSLKGDLGSASLCPSKMSIW